MPSRPRSHELEELSRIHLQKVFTDAGWVIEDMHHDYGEDLLVRIFNHGLTTHLSFFVQAKATDHIDKYLHRDGKTLGFPIDADHIEHWRQFWEPVILTVWDAKSDVTYWESIQDYLETYKVSGDRRKTIHIKISLDNILNEVSLKRIVVRTRTRFARFEREREGAQVLIDLLEEELRVKIEYDPQMGFLLIEKPEGGARLIAFGKFAAELDRLGSKLGIPKEDVLEKSLELYKRLIQLMPDGARMSVVDEEGNTVKSFGTLKDIQRLAERDAELREYDDES